MVEAFARARRHVAQRAAAEQRLQFGERRLWRIETRRSQRAGVDAVAGRDGAPERLPRHLGLLRLVACIKCHQRGEFLRHRSAVHAQFGLERRPLRITEREGEALAQRRIGGNVVRLLVGEHLHAVFQPAQETVGRAQPLRAARRHQAELLAGSQRRQQPAHAQGRFAAAADQLHQLHDELDFADAAGSELEVARRGPCATTSASISAFISRRPANAV